VQRIHHKPIILLVKVFLIRYGFYIEITLSSHENYGRAEFSWEIDGLSKYLLAVLNNINQHLC
jgi:hypothetical protein